MSNFWVLFKVNFINTFGLSKLKKKFAKSSTFSKIGLPIIVTVLVIIILAFLFFYVFLFSSIFISVGKYIGILLVAVVVGSIFSLVTTLTKANSYLFEAKDYDLLLSLPIKSSTVIASKLSNLFLLNYMSFGAIYIPSVTIYAIYVNPPVYFYLISLLVLIVGPLLLVAVGSGLSYLIAMALSRFKYKGAIQSVFMIAFIIVIMVGSMSFNQTSEMEQGDLIKLVDNLINTLEKIYYPATWAVNGMTGDFLELLLYFGVSIIPITLFVYFVGRNFMKASEKVKRTYRDKNFKLKTQSNSNQIVSLVKREFKMYYSNPSVAMNVSTGPIVSTIFVCMFIFGAGSFGLEGVVIADNMKVAILIILQLFMSGISPTTASSISLEGKSFWIIKSSPLKVATVFKGKIGMSLLLIVPFTIINAIVGAIVLKLSIVNILILLILPIMFNVFTSVIGLFMNLCFPRLDWDNPLKPVKQSVPVLLTLVINWIFLFGCAAVFIVLMPINIYIAFLGVFTIILVAIILAYILTFKVGENKYLRIQA